MRGLLVVALFALAGLAAAQPPLPVFSNDYIAYVQTSLVNQPSGAWYLDGSDVCCPVESNCAAQSQGQSMETYWAYYLNASRSDADNGQILIDNYTTQQEATVAITNNELVCQYYCPMQGDLMTPGPTAWTNTTVLSYGGMVSVSGQEYPSWNWTTYMIKGVPVETSQFAANIDINPNAPVWEFDNITMLGQFAGVLITKYQSYSADQPAPSMFNVTNWASCPVGTDKDCGNNNNQLRRLKQRRHNTYRYYAALNALREQVNKIEQQEKKEQNLKVQAAEAKRLAVVKKDAVTSAIATPSQLRHAKKNKKASKPLPVWPAAYTVYELDAGATFQGPYSNETTTLCCPLDSQCVIQTQYQGATNYYSPKNNATRTDYSNPPPLQTQIAFFTQQRDCLVVNGVCTEYCPIQGDYFSSGWMDPNATYTGSVVVAGVSYDKWQWWDWLGIGNLTMSSSILYVNPATAPQTPWYEFDMNAPLGQEMGYDYATYSNIVWGEPDASLFNVKNINTAPQGQNCQSNQQQVSRLARGLVKTHAYYAQLKAVELIQAAVDGQE